MRLAPALLLGAFCYCAPALARQAARPDAAAPAAPARIVVHGSVRARVEAWDWFRADAAENTYAFSGNVFRLNASKSTDRHDWMAELEAPLLAGLPNRSAAPGAQGQLGLGAAYYAANRQRRFAAMVFPKQLFFRWKKLGGNTGQELRVGRFEFSDGAERAPVNAVLAAVKREHINQRMIGSFGFTHVGRSFDGVEYTFKRPVAGLTVLVAVPTRGVFQVDGWGWNRVGLAYGSYTHEWNEAPRASEVRVFAMEYIDWRRVLKTDNRPGAVRSSDSGKVRIETFGAHALHTAAVAAGTADLLAWGAGQAGRWGSQTHRAWSVDFEAGFQPKAVSMLKPWLRVGIMRGSGDRNPADERHGTFFQMLPTPRIYARFPFFNMMNVEDAFFGIALRPGARLTISTESHLLSLSSAADLWYAGGGVFQPWTFGYSGRSSSGSRSLANLYDAQLDYRHDPSVTVTGYLGYAAGRAVPQKIYPRGKNAAFGFVEITRRF